MEYRVAGSTGLKLSVLGLGSLFKPSQHVHLNNLEAMVSYAVTQGVNYFDTAESYADGRSELYLGRALKKLRLSRDSYCISSKVYWGGKLPTQSGLSRKHIIEGCEGILKRLSLDYVDFLLCHRTDPKTSVDDIVWSMNTLISQGKILYWGTSGWTLYQIMQAYLSAQRNHLIPPVIEQAQYNLLTRQQVEIDYAQLSKDYNLAITTWSPLCHGLLTGKYNNQNFNGTRLSLPEYQWLKQKISEPQAKHDLNKIIELTKIAQDIGLNMSQLAIAWCISNPNITSVLLGCKDLQQLETNLAAVDKYQKLSKEKKIIIENILDNHPLPQRNFYEKYY